MASNDDLMPRRSLPWPMVVRLAAALAAVLTLGLAPASQPANPPAQGTPTFRVVPASRQANHIAVIPVRGPLDAFMTSSLERRLARAKALGADAVVLEIDSDFSSLGTVSEAIAVLKDGGIPQSVAWVRSRAVGGAGLLALSCRDIIVTDGGALGGLIEPGWLEGAFTIRTRGRTTTNAAILQNAATALSTAIDAARRTGRDEFLVQALAVPGVELWLVQNAATGERRCINEPEYRLLFGKDPTRSGAELAPALGLPALQPYARGLARNPAAATVPMTPPAATSPGLSAPWPASPTAAAILTSQGAASEVTTPSARTPLTAADFNRWTLVTYAVEPGAPATLHGDQLVKYGVAQQVVRTDSDLTAYFGAQKVTRLEQSWAEHAARFLANPFVRGILIAIFLVSMFVELSHPGLVIPGLIASAMLILILAPAFIVGVSGWWSLGAIALGVVLLALEIFVIPGFGVAGVVGLIVLFVGLVFTFLPDGPAGLAFSSPEAQNALLRGVVTVLLSSVTAVFGLFFVIRQLGTIPLLQRYTLQSPGPGEVDESIFGPIRPDENASVAVGEVGTATTPLRPAGKALFGADYFDVVAEGGYVQEGTAVRVVEADRFRIVVAAVKAAPPAPAAPGDT